MACKNSFVVGIETAEQELDKVIQSLDSFDTILEKSKNSALYLDQPKLQSATAIINTIVRDPDVDLTPYPAVLNRIKTAGPLLTNEIGDFVNDYGYLPIDTLINTVRPEYAKTLTRLQTGDEVVLPPSTIHPGTTTVLGQLELFFNNNYAAAISGSVCSVFAEAFAAISKIGVLIGEAADTIKKIKDINLADYINNLKPLELIKKKIDQILDDIQKELQDRAKQLVDSVQKQLDKLESLTTGIAKQINEEYNRIRRLLDDVNKEKIKQQVDKFLASAVAQFEDIKDNPAIIPYLAYRVCQAIGGVQKVFEDPVKAFSERSKERVTRISTMDANLKQQQARLKTNGGSRITRVEAASAKRTAYAAHQGSSSSGTRGGGSIATRPASGTPIQYPLTGADIAIGNRFEIVKSGNRFTKVENQYITLQPQVMNEGIDWPYNNDDDGWMMCDQQLWALVWKLGQKLGTQLSINSGFRSPAKNASVGGAKGSFHKKGMAADISTRSSSVDPIELIRNASLLGFKGIGGYRTFIHVDIRPTKATWNQSGSSAIAEALRIHMSNTVTFDDTPSSAKQSTLVKPELTQAQVDAIVSNPSTPI